jgi:hypothetical protein
MTKEELAKILHDMYSNAGDRKQVAMIHMFGIKYGEKIQMVLGDHDKQEKNDDYKFIVSESTDVSDLFGFDQHDEFETDKVSYSVKDKFSAQAYLKITKSS